MHTFIGKESILRNGLSAKGACWRCRVLVCLYVCVCVTSPVKKKSRLCAQGVRLAWHYTSKTLLGGPKKELALAKLMLCHFPEKLPPQPVSHRVADKGRGLSLLVRELTCWVYSLQEL